MTAASVFGPLVAAVQVEDHIAEVVARWFPSYLYEVERTNGIEAGTLPSLRSVVRSSELERFPEDQLPCLMIGSPGLTDPPEHDGAGYYVATWQINLGIELAAGPNRRALELARLYALAARACVLQQQQDPGLEHPAAIVRVDWRDERYDVLDSVDDRTVCAGRVELAVTVADVTRIGQGPLDPLIPPQDPGPTAPAWPTAQNVITDVTRQE